MVPLAPKPHRADLKMGPVGPGKIAGPVLLHNKWAIFHHSCRVISPLMEGISNISNESSIYIYNYIIELTYVG